LARPKITPHNVQDTESGDPVARVQPVAPVHPNLAPLCVKRASFPPCECAPVLAAVKQKALDRGCGPALAGGGGSGAENGSPGWLARA